MIRKMSVFIWFFLAGCSGNLIQNDPVTGVPNLIGEKYDDLPDGYGSLYWSCLTDLQPDGRFCKYIVKILHRDPGQEFVSILALRLVQIRKDAPMRWIVTDQISYPEMSSEHEYLSYGECWYDGSFDQKIVALAENTNAAFHSVKRYAWKLNLITEKFDELDPRRVKCRNYSGSALIDGKDIIVSPGQVGE